MSFLTTRSFRVENATNFRDKFVETANSESLYIFIGRSTPWPSDTAPTQVYDGKLNIEVDSWNNMLSAKRIISSDIVFGAIRYNWTSGTVYTKWTDKAEVWNSQFYIVNSNLQVYKCIDNNNGAPSTAEPFLDDLEIFATSDGYRWKFMYAVSAPDALKYLTRGFFPVRHLLVNNGTTQWDVQNAAANCAIDRVEVNSGGINYRSHTGTVAAANTSTITLDSGASGLNGFYTGSDVYITGGLGTGQLRRILSYSGSTKRAILSAPFSTVPNILSTFQITPHVEVQGDGQAWSGYTEASGGSITKVNVLNGGNNFSFGNIVFSANGGSGATATAIISPMGGHGSNAVEELGACNVMMNLKLTGSESNTVTISNDYRCIGLISNPKVSNGSIAFATNYDATTKFITNASSGTFQSDELITGLTSGATGRLVSFANNKMSIVNVVGDFANEIVTGGTSGATANVASRILPQLKKYTGKVLYMENRTPITRSSSQQEDFKVVVRF
jgi:hypothetical protein